MELRLGEAQLLEEAELAGRLGQERKQVGRPKQQTEIHPVGTASCHQTSV
jgi:hypothetical protein